MAHLRFQFIYQHHEDFGIKWLCLKLKLSRQGYCRFLNHHPTERQQKYSELRTIIIPLFFKFKLKMGAEMFYHHLTNEGSSVSLGFVKSVLTSYGLKSKVVKTYKKHIKPHQTFENQLNRQFSATTALQVTKKIICDITE